MLHIKGYKKHLIAKFAVLFICDKRFKSGITKKLFYVKHPISNTDKLKDEIKSRNFRRTNHYNLRLQTRDLIEHSQVTSKLEDMSDLEAFEYKKDGRDNERYNLVFSRSNKYYLLIALSFVNNHLNLITAFVTRKSRGSPDELASRWG